MAEDYRDKEQEQKRTDMELVLLDVSHKKKRPPREQEELSQEEEARRRARIRARQRRNKRRIQQRNRRIALVVVGTLCVIGAIGVGVGKIKQNKAAEQKAKQAYAEQEAKKKEKEKDTPAEEGIQTAKDSEKNQWYLKLVNGKNPLDEDNLPEITTAPVQGGVYMVDERIIDDLEEMLSDAYSDGRTPVVCSAYRDWDTQTVLFQNKIARVKQEKGLTGEAAETEAATVWQDLEPVSINLDLLWILQHLLIPSWMRDR